MAGLMVLAYLFVVAYWIPRQVYKFLDTRSKLVRMAAFAATSILLTLGPFLPDAYVIQATHQACEGKAPYKIGSAKADDWLGIETINRGRYTEEIRKYGDKVSGALAYESYEYIPNAPGPFAWLLTPPFKALHPFSSDKTCPFSFDAHYSEMQKQYKAVQAEASK